MIHINFVAWTSTGSLRRRLSQIALLSFFRARPMDLDGARENTASNARLRHEVILLRGRKRCVTEQIFGTAHIRRISDRPECRRGRAETMQIDWKAKRLSGA